MSAGDPADRLAAAGHTLPPAPEPRGLYAPTCTVPLDAHRAWVHVSGQTCRVQGVAQAGICRTEADICEAAAAAQVAMLNALAALGASAQGLANVLQVVRVRGFIRSTPDFGRHGPVLDGASRILVSAFPDHPPPARSAVGVADLPDHAWLEIELEAVVRVQEANQSRCVQESPSFSPPA
ncbi:RidA family protein [Hydrogenophaga sp.]|uniref:RidA family protein n=1 Tax=Hydrogenophaga sp. TaxID=1904254 RepID=UPI002FC88BE8